MTHEELDLVERLVDVKEDCRSDAIRQSIRRGAQAELVRIALQRYQDGDVGIRGAAELAGLTISEMTYEANERKVLSNYDTRELSDDVDTLRPGVS